MHTTTPDAPEVTERVWNLPAYLVDEAARIIDKATRRALRHGLAPYVVEVAEGTPRPVFDDQAANGAVVMDLAPFGEVRVPTRNGTPCTVEGVIDTVDITVRGEMPRIAGWDVVAVVEMDPEAGVMTRTWPGSGDVDLTALRSRTASECDHCNKDRDRAKVYALRNAETGEIKQVGSTCLALFLGLTLDLNLDRGFDADPGDELDGLGGGGFDTSHIRYTTAYVVEVATAVVSLFGYVSRADADLAMGKTATADRVKACMSPRRPAERELAALVWDAMTEETAAKAVKVLAYAQGMDAEDGAGEYARNVAAVARPERVTPKNVGLLASAVTAYDRHVQREIEREVERAAAGDSAWQGTVKKRQVFAGLRLTMVKPCESDFGVSYLVKFVDAAGNRFSWFSSRGVDAEVGEVVDVKGTVKAHQEWQGVKETALSRCVLTPTA